MAPSTGDQDSPAASQPRSEMAAIDLKTPENLGEIGDTPTGEDEIQLAKGRNETLLEIQATDESHPLAANPSDLTNQSATFMATGDSNNETKADSVAQRDVAKAQDGASSRTIRIPAPIALGSSHELSATVTADPVIVTEMAASLPLTPNLGAWSKPLHFTTPATQLGPANTQNYTESQASLWPSLHDGLRDIKRKKQKHGPTNILPNIPVEKLPPPALKPDGSLRFPWAAKMNPATRNLFRATEPTYRNDGTPEVIIPRKVLLLSPENHEQYVIGNFFRCSSPPGGLVHAVVNKLWGRSCKITCRKTGDSTFLFHIPHEGTRSWVLQRGLWHIDDCLLFVAPWSPAATFDIEISTVPVWVNLKKIPDRLYSRVGISHIASGLGEPMMTHKPYLDPTLMGEAKILVEVELDKPFPKQIALDDKQGNVFLVDVQYTWIPSVCDRCGHLGHKEKRCLLASSACSLEKQSKAIVREHENIPVVDVQHLLEGNNNTLPSQIVKEQSLMDQNKSTVMVMGKPTSASLGDKYEQQQTTKTSPNSGSDNQQGEQKEDGFGQITVSTEGTLVVSNPTALAHKDTQPRELSATSSLKTQPHESSHEEKVTTNIELQQQQQNISSHEQFIVKGDDETTTLPSHPQQVSLTSIANSLTQSLTLAGLLPAPTQQATMEEIPSLPIISKSNKISTDDPYIGSPLNKTNNFHMEAHEMGGLSHNELPSEVVIESESSARLGLSRGGRPIKPTQKFQDLGWTQVGRGKHGRRGRGKPY